MDQRVKRIVVLYGTKYGSTKRYAEWIAEITCAEIFEVSTFDQSLLDDYDVVLFGSPVYLGKIKYISFVKRNRRILSTKKVIIFSVTLLPPDDLRQKRIFQRSLPIEVRKNVAYYPLRGVFNFRKLSFVDKLLMSEPRIRLHVNWWIKRNKEAKERLVRFYSLLDWTSKDAIEPIVMFAQGDSDKTEHHGWEMMTSRGEE